MNIAAILAAIATAVQYAELALKVGADAMPFILKIREWLASPASVTQADVDAMNAMGQPYLDALNDTSHDDPTEVFQGGE